MKLKKRPALSTALAVPVLISAAAPSPGAGTPVVTGQGHWSTQIGTVGFQISLQELPDGSLNGHGRSHLTGAAANSWFQFEVIDYQHFGDEIAVLGLITSTHNTPPSIPVGSQTLLRIPGRRQRRGLHRQSPERRRRPAVLDPRTDPERAAPHRPGVTRVLVPTRRRKLSVPLETRTRRGLRVPLAVPPRIHFPAAGAWLRRGRCRLVGLTNRPTMWRLGRIQTGPYDEAMNLKATMKELESLGIERMRVMNTKNGASDNQFGVKMGDIRALAKRIKVDHDLALELWQTGNEDARFLAILLMNPESLSRKELNEMVRSLTFTHVAIWFQSYVLKKHPEREALREKWMKVKHPMAARAGWGLTAERVAKEPDGLDLPALLKRIEAEMGSASSEAQWNMNVCLVEIGIHFPKHRKRALAIGESLGVYRDLPTSKGCTSPFAPVWINAIVRRQG